MSKNSFDYGIHYRGFHDDSLEHANHYADYFLQTHGRWLPERKDITALDLGCGMGFAMLGLKKAGYRDVCGVDIDSSQIASCKGKGLNVELIDSLPDYLSRNISRFGLITMTDVLEHIQPVEQLEALRRIYSSLEPGGRLLVQVPNANSIVASRWRYIDFTHYCAFTEHSARFAMLASGFDSVTIPSDDQFEPRPSLRPGRLFSRENREQFRRWCVRRLWRQVLLAEFGESEVSKMPIGGNFTVIADKAN